MSLAAGTKLGPYEIVSPLGAGGMGEVYRALVMELVEGQTLTERIARGPIPLEETLSGKQLYSGETAPETLAHVITKDPDWESMKYMSGLFQLMGKWETTSGWFPPTAVRK